MCQGIACAALALCVARASTDAAQTAPIAPHTRAPELHAHGAPPVQPTGIRLGARRTSLPTSLVGEVFASELVGTNDAADALTTPELRAIVELWERWRVADREMRSTEDQTLTRMNRDAADLTLQRDRAELEAVVSRYLMVQSAATRGQISRVRDAVNMLGEAALDKGFDPDRIADALRLAHAIAALQQADGLIDGGALPGADIDMFTATLDIVEALRKENAPPTQLEMTTLFTALKEYAHAVGPLQANRLTIAASVGARGTAPGMITPPAIESGASTAASWKLHYAHLEWLPKILGAMPASVRARAEPEFHLIMAPQVFPDHACMGPVIERRAMTPMKTPESEQEMKILREWFEEAYRNACQNLVFAQSAELESSFGSDRPGRLSAERAERNMHASLERRTAINERAAVWLMSLDPEMDMPAARHKAESDMRHMEGLVNRKRAARRPVNAWAGSKP